MVYISPKHVEKKTLSRNAFIVPQKGHIAKLETWYNHDASVEKQIDFCVTHEIYANWVTDITNNHIANPLLHMRRRIIISNIQLQLKRDYFEKHISGLTYNLMHMRQIVEISPAYDVGDIQKRSADTDCRDINKLRAIIKTM